MELDTVPQMIFDNDKTAWFSEPDGTSMLQTFTFTGRAGNRLPPPEYR
jgi:hypothetical protein